MLQHAAAVLAALTHTNIEEVAAKTGTMLPTLVRLLAWHGPVAEWTAALLANLAKSLEQAEAILAAGILPQLVATLINTNATEDEQTMAAYAMATLAMHESTAAAVVAAGALPPLIPMLGSHNAALQEAAVAALQNLACSCKAAEVAAGAILCLRTFYEAATAAAACAARRLRPWPI